MLEYIPGKSPNISIWIKALLYTDYRNTDTFSQRVLQICSQFSPVCKQVLTELTLKNSKQTILSGKYIMKTYIHNNPVMAILTGAFIISFSGVWVKLCEVAPASSAFYRVFFGFIFLLLASLISKDFPSIDSKRLFWLLLCAAFFALDLTFWHASIGYIGPGLATMIGNFQVFMLAAVGVLFLGEQVRIRFLLSIPLAFLGLYLVIGANLQDLDSNYRLG